MHKRVLQAPHSPPRQAKGQFKKQSVANGVEISVPVPSDADSPRFKTSVGSAKYVPEKNVVIWSIKSFPVSTGGGGHLADRPHCLRARLRVNGRPNLHAHGYLWG